MSKPGQADRERAAPAGMPTAQPTITAVVLTKNEAGHIDDCLAGLAWADERLVIDSASLDATVARARAAGARTIVHPFRDFADQRNFALDQVTTDWILFVDADERVTPKLAAEVRRRIADPAGPPGYWIPRRNLILGRWMRHTGWWPDEQLRLFRPAGGRYATDRPVHEIVELTGSPGHLDEPLIHLNYDRWSQFFTKQLHYSRLEARRLRASGQPFRRRALIGQPFREFYRRYIAAAGYRDGLHGAILSTLLAWFTLVTYLRLLWPVGQGTATEPTGQAAVEPPDARRLPRDLMPPTPTLDLSVIIVSYNVRDLLAECLASVRADLARWGGRGEILVVDNASGDGSADLPALAEPGVRAIRNPENVGFGRAVNQALGRARGEACLILNPDARLQPGALAELTGYLAEHPDVGLVGPRLLNTDGSLQSSRRRFPTVWTGLIESTRWERYFARSALIQRFHAADLPTDRPVEVDWLVGACLLVRRAAIEMVGGFDERFFMYFEEVDWCRRLRQAGWRIVSVPSAEVVHHYGQSAVQDLARRQIVFDASKRAYYRKHHGPIVAAGLRAFLAGTYLFQIGEEAAKLALGHRPALRRQRLADWRRILRSA